MLMIRVWLLLIVASIWLSPPSLADINVRGQLKNAQAEILSSDPTGKDGRLYWNTATDSFKWYDLTGTAWRTGVDTNSNQTLTNKTLTSPSIGTPSITSAATLTEVSTPSNPSAGFLKVYAKTDDKLYTLNSSGTERAVGSGSGTGLNNLISGGDAEDAATDPWATYADAAAAAPVDGTGGSPNVTKAITTTSGDLISGTGTWKLSKSAANRQGEGWSVNFSLPAKSALYSSLVTLSFDYYMSTTAVSDVIRVYLYDRDNSTLITPQFVTCGGGSTPTLTSTTTACHAELAWVSTTADDYRLIFHVASSSSTAVDLYVDNLYTGEYKAAVGAAVGPWEAFTPTSAWTANITWSGAFRRRVGDSMEILASASLSGAATSATFTLSVPNSLTADAAKYGSLSNVGRCFLYDSGTTANDQNVHAIISGGAVACVANNGSAVDQATPFTWASGDQLRLHAVVPISQWAGGTDFGENRVSYYYSTGNTWGTTNDSATTSQGMGGVAGGTTTPAGTAFRYTFTPSTPVPVGSKPFLEISSNQTYWGTTPFFFNGFGSGPNVESLRYDGTNFIGAGVSVSDTGKLVVTFGKYASGTSSAWTGTWYWRVVVPSPGAAVGFGLASTASPGLYQAGQAPGTATNDNAAAGSVGEIKEVSLAFASRNGLVNNTAENLVGSTLDLTAGDWEISGIVFFYAAASTTVTEATASINTSSATLSADSTLGVPSSGAFKTQINQASSAPNGLIPLVIPSYRVPLSGAQSYFVVVRALFASSTLEAFGRVQARRVR